MRSTPRGTFSPGEQVAPRRSCLLSSWRGGASGISFPSYQNLHPKHRVILSTLFFSDFWKNPLYTLLFTCIFMISFIILQTLYMSLHYVPLITCTFTTYIFIISFIFTCFQEKLSISLIANDSYLCIDHHMPVKTLYMWSHLKHTKSPWRIIIPRL